MFAKSVASQKLASIGIWAMAALSPTLLVVPAMAQSVSPVQANLDVRARARALLISPETAARDALLSGRNDIVLLAKPALFTVSASIDTTHSSNAFMRPEDDVADTATNSDLGVQIGTRIASRFDVSASLVVSNQTYSKYSELDYNSVQASLGVAARLKGFEIDLRVSPSRIYDSKFKQVQLTQQQSQVTVAYPLQLKGVNIVPSIFASRSNSNPVDYNNTAYGIDISAARRLSTSWPLTAFVSVGYQQRAYDAYFPDLLGVERTDKLTRASIGFEFDVGKVGAIGVQYSVQDNQSTSDVNGFKATNGGLSLRLRHRF